MTNQNGYPYFLLGKDVLGGGVLTGSRERNREERGQRHIMRDSCTHIHTLSSFMAADVAH